MSTPQRKPLFMLAMDAACGKQLTPADKLVFAYLAVKQGHKGKSWPGIETIMRDLDLAKQTVLDSTIRLCRVGLIDKTPGRRGRGHSAHYSVRLEKIPREQTFIGDEKCPVSRPFDCEKRSTPQTQKVYPVDMNISGSNQYTTIAHTAHSRRGGNRKPKTQVPRPPFTPPTVDEVQDYAESRGDPQFDAGRFIDYYQEREWTKVNGQPVENWKLTVCQWINRDNQRRIERGEPPHDGYSQYGTRPVSEEKVLAALKG